MLRLLLAVICTVLVAGCGDVTINELPEREGDDPGECTDSADNDGNGLFDCEDPACSGAPECQPNRAPSAPEIQIQPIDPRTDDELRCLIDVGALDPDGDEVEYTWSWTVDDVDAGIAGASIDPGQTVRGETWSCSLTAADPAGLASPTVSASVTVGNTPPTAPEIAIVPLQPRTTQDILCEVVEPSFDLDGDDINYTLEWFLNGSPYASGAHITWQETTVGDQWTCVVRPDDSIDEGPAAETIDSVGRGSLPLAATGRAHTCQIYVTGETACWGDDSYGQVSGLQGNGWAVVDATADFTCAIDAFNANGMCWGEDANSQLALPGAGLLDLAVGNSHGCASQSTGLLAQWGSALGWAEVPPSGNEWIAVGAGTDFCCSVATNNQLECWGPGTPENGPSQAELVSGGDGFACSLRGGDVTCWGSDSYGQVSDAPDSNGWVHLDAGRRHACALASGTGFVTCWGDNGAGQADAPDGQFLGVSAGRYHSCATRADGQIVCWGCEGQDAGQCDVP